MATIKDVAARAGVSVKTVSRVINDHKNISDKTRAKVEATIRALSFSPSPIARQMRLGRFQSIGMMYGDPSSGYQSQLNHSILKACSDARRYLAVELFDENSLQWSEQVTEFLDRTKVTSMVLVPPMCDSGAVHALLKERGVKFVLVSPSSPVAGASSVAMDERLAAKEMTQHLIDMGHERIGFIAGREGHVASLLRRLGYEDALKAQGLEDINQTNIYKGEFDFQKALHCAAQMLASPDRPTAIFAANDHMAIAVMMTAHSMGLSIPDDLSVAGFDNTPVGQWVWPPLTTIAQPFDAFAEAAVKVLNDYENEQDSTPSYQVLPHKLIQRQSTGQAKAV